MQRVLASVAAMAVACGALAQVTSLFSIPVADTQGVREVEMGYFISGNERNVDKAYYHYGYAVLGIHERVEVAASTDFTGSNPWGFKVKLFDGPGGKYALSAGFQNIIGKDSEPFIVGRYDFDKFRLHGGWYRNDRSRLICGVDFGLSDALSVAIDHYSGENGTTWGGVFYSLPWLDGLTAAVFVGLPNTKADGVQHSIGLIYGFRF